MKKGYIIALLSFVISFIAFKENLLEKIEYSLLVTYCIWSCFWGIKIVEKHINEMFSEIRFFRNNIFDSIKGFYLKKIWYYFILIIFGYLVGVLGGGIFTQIKLMLVK